MYPATTKSKTCGRSQKERPQNFTKLLIQKDNEIAELKEKIFQLNSIIAAVPGHLYWKDKNGIYLGCNDQQAKSLGLKNGKTVVGKTDKQLPWKKEAAFLQKLDKQVMTTGKSITDEEPVTLSDKSKAIFLSKKTPLYDSKKNVNGILGISFDITERKHAEELRKEKEIAQKTSKLMEAVSGAVAHEMRTPLTTIYLHAELLESILFSKNSTKTEQEKAKIYKEYIGIIKNTALSANVLIDNILLKLNSFAKGKFENIDFQPTSISSDIKHLLAVYPFKSGEKELVTMDIDADFTYLGQPILTRHVLINLLKNSLKAIKEIDRQGKITITCKQTNKHNQVILRDNATGIPAEFLPHIFDPFATAAKLGKGTGLGLTFCKMVMELYQGDITCTSKFGKYTEFVLHFPKI